MAAIDREDGRVLIYLHFGEKHWYFFEYKALQGWMNLTVQEQLEPEETGLATVVQELKESEKRIKEGNKQFLLQLDNTPREKESFVEQYREFDD